MKRIWTLLLAAVMLATCLSSFALAEEKPYEGVEVTVALNSPSDAVRDAYDEWLEGLKSQILEETGIVMKVEMVAWADYLNKHLMSVASGEGPDIIQMGSGVPPVIAATGGLVDLTDYMDMFGGYDAYVDAGHHYMTYDGEIIAIPWGGAGREMYYNKNIYDAAGLEYPVEGWTWEDFVEDVEALTAYMGQPSFAFCGAGAETTRFIWGDVITNGGAVLDDEGNLAFNNELGVAAIRKILDLYEAGHIRSSFAETDMSGCLPAFINEEVALAFGSASYWMDIEASPLGENYGTVTQPVGSTGLKVGAVTLSELGVMAYTPNLDATLTVLSYMTSDESFTTSNNVLGWLPWRTELMDQECFSTKPVFETLKTVIRESHMWLPQHAKVSAIESSCTSAINQIWVDVVNGTEVSDEEIQTRLDALAVEVGNLVNG